MGSVQLKYGKKVQEAVIESKNLMGILQADILTAELTDELERKEIERSLDNPLGSKRIEEKVRPGQKIVIMASDITRPSPTKKILEALLPRLRSAGVEDKDIMIVFGMGIHRSHTEEEQKKLVGEAVYNSIRCVDSNTEDYVNIGFTKRGTPLNFCRSVVKADVRICTGNIEYHYFAGYSGGAKAILPGAADYECIKNNHSLQLLEGAQTGRIEGNPVREDIDEVGTNLEIDFIVNVVLDEQKKVLKSFAGDFIDAHRAGCTFLDTLYSIKIDDKPDIVLVSCGGYPKDINLYQAQKALDNAAQAVKDGGIIILVAECSEGFGEKTFAEWINEANKPDDLIERLRREFVLGGHKAAAIARVLQRAKVFIVTAMDKGETEKAFLIHKKSVEEALEHALEEKGKQAKVLVIPQGGSVLPSHN